MKQFSPGAAAALLLSAVTAAGSVSFLGPCVHEDGSFGSCHWAGEAMLGIGLLLAALSLTALLVKDGLKEMKKAMDADEIGGTAFLGISKPVIKAHGSSKANAIFAAIRQAKVFSESGFTDEIKENIDLLKIDSAEG